MSFFSLLPAKVMNMVFKAIFIIGGFGLIHSYLGWVYSFLFCSFVLLLWAAYRSLKIFVLAVVLGALGFALTGVISLNNSHHQDHHTPQSQKPRGIYVSI